VQLGLPVRWHCADGAGHGLRSRVAGWRVQRGPVDVTAVAVVPEPVLVGFVRLGDWMSRKRRVV
jgi:hypothetical protein